MTEELKMGVIVRALTSMPGILAAARARVDKGDSKAQAVMRAVGQCGGSHPEIWMTSAKGVRVQVEEADFWIKWQEVAEVCFAAEKKTKIMKTKKTNLVVESADEQSERIARALMGGGEAELNGPAGEETGTSPRPSPHAERENVQGTSLGSSDVVASAVAGGSAGRPACDEDEGVIQECIEVVRSENNGSVALLQRRLRLGYTRAARIIDELERRGVVGPSKGAEPREVLDADDLQHKVSGLNGPVGEETGTSPRPSPHAERGNVQGTSLGSGVVVASPVGGPSGTDDYEGRARGMDRAAGDRILAELGEHWAAFQLAVKSAQFNTVKVVNLARSMGQQIELFTDHQKLSQGDWLTHLAPVLPDAAWEFGKHCQALYHRHQVPVSGDSAAGLKLALAEFESLLKQMELLPKGSHGEQVLRPAEPVREFLTEASRLGVASKKWLAQIEARTIDVAEFKRNRGMLLAETAPIVELREWLSDI